MFQNKSLFRMLLIKKNVQWTLIHEPKTEKRVHVQWTWIHESENGRAKPLGDIESFTNVSIPSQPIQLVIQRTVPRIILTTRIIKQNSSTNHSPFSRYKIGRINNKAKSPKMNRMVFSLFLFSYYTLILYSCPTKKPP